MTRDPATPTPSAERLLLRLAESLHHAGVSAHRLEQIINDCGDRLGVRTTIFAVPTGMTIAFGEPGAQRVSVMRVRPGGIDLERVHELYRLVGDLLSGEVHAPEAHRRLDVTLARRPRYGAFLELLGFAVASASAARVFGAGLTEISVSAVVGALVGLVHVAFDRDPRRAPLTEFVSGAVASAGAWGAAALVGPIRPSIVALAAVIVMLPGLTLTVSINELATRNLTSGTTRLMGAVMTFVAIGFGVAIGNTLGPVLSAEVDHVNGVLPDWTLPLSLLGLAGALVVLFRARPADAGWVIAAVVTGYAGAVIGGSALGPELGVCIGAIFVGLLGNLANRFLSRPAGLFILPGLMALVPGSVGYRGVSSFLEDNITAGVDAIFNVVMIAAALVVGLLIADVAVPTRRPL